MSCGNATPPARFIRALLYGLLIAVFSTIGARTAGAQVLYGSIVGNVADAQGGVMPGVTLTATNTGTDAKAETVSDESGAYTFRNLLPGTYDLTASLTGFREYQEKGIPVSAGNPVRVNVTLAVGAISEVVQVTSEKTFENWLIRLVTGGLLLLLNLLFPYEIDFNIRLYQSFLVNTAEAILGILFVLALSRQLDLHTTRLAAFFKYLGSISLIILLFHVPIQAFWAQKVENVTGNFPLGILVGFVMGVIGPILIYEIFIRFNPVAAWWFGRKSEGPAKREPEFPAVNEETAASTKTPVVEIKEP